MSDEEVYIHHNGKGWRVSVTIKGVQIILNRQSADTLAKKLAVAVQRLDEKERT